MLQSDWLSYLYNIRPINYQIYSLAPDWPRHVRIVVISYARPSMSNQLTRCPLLYDWSFPTCAKLEIILFLFHCRVITLNNVHLVRSAHQMLLFK